MKIVYCIRDLSNSGGMERVLTNKVNYLVEKYKYEIFIITTDFKNKNSFYYLNRNIKVIDLGINYFKKSENILLKVVQQLEKKRKHKKKLKTEVDNIKPDILISMGHEEKNFLPFLKVNCKKIREFHFAKNYKVALEKAINRNILYKMNSYICNFLENYYIKYYDKVIILTKEDKNNWQNNNICIIPNSLTFYSKNNSAKLENKKIISVGRLMPQKGYDILIDIWNIVSNKYPDWVLEIYGEGPERKKLQNKINKLRLEKSLLLKGTVKNIQKKYMESSIYVMSSRFEGFGMVLVEAMACGVPTVSFASPCGPKDIINDNEDGFLIEFGNIQKMAEKIEVLISDEKKRKMFGKNAKKNIERFSEDRIMNQWKELFENILEKYEKN